MPGPRYIPVHGVFNTMILVLLYRDVSGYGVRTSTTGASRTWRCALRKRLNLDLYCERRVRAQYKGVCFYVPEGKLYEFQTFAQRATPCTRRSGGRGLMKSTITTITTWNSYCWHCSPLQQ
eukprot:1412688-Rhodomonas_salina.3